MHLRKRPQNLGHILANSYPYTWLHLVCEITGWVDRISISRDLYRCIVVQNVYPFNILDWTTTTLITWCESANNLHNAMSNVLVITAIICAALFLGAATFLAAASFCHGRRLVFGSSFILWQEKASFWEQLHYVAGEG